MAEGARITIDAQLQFRHDVEANWLAADPILKVGEPAYTIGYSDRFKLGDGQSKWSELPYLQLGEGGSGGGSQAYESLAWSAIKNLTSGSASVLAQAYAVKQAYTELKSLIPNLADYYTKEQINALIPSLTGYATEAWVLDKGYATESFVKTKIADLINGAPTTLDTLKEIADAFAASQDVIEALDEAIGKKANQSDLTALAARVAANEGNITSLSSNKLDKSVWDSVFEIDAKGNLRAKVGIYSTSFISARTSDPSAGGGSGGGGAFSLYTWDQVKAMTAEVGGVAPTAYALKQAYDELINVTPTLSWNNIQDKPIFATVATSGSYSDLIGRPTALSDLANDAGYITSAAIPSTYAWSAITGTPTTFEGYGLAESFPDYGNKGAIDFNDVLYNGFQYTSGSSSNKGFPYGILASFRIGDSAWQILGGRDHNRLMYRGGNGTSTSWGDWKTIAFTDSNVASADYATSAGSADYLSRNYANENVNLAKGDGVKMIYTTASGSNMPIYTSGISVITEYCGWQMVSYAVPSELPNPYYRAMGSNGSYTMDWRQLAFLDDNVASATKLQTGRYLWGNYFSGEQNISSALFLNSGGDGIYVDYNGINYHNSGNSWIATNINFQSNGGLWLSPYGGNVGIGTTEPAYKLDVNGTAKFTSIHTPAASTFNKLCESHNSYEINQMANINDGAPSGYPYGYLTTYRWNNGNWSGQMYLTVADFGGEIFTRGYRDDQGKWTIWRKAFLDDGYGNLTVSGTIYSAVGMYSPGYISARSTAGSSDRNLKTNIAPVKNALAYILGTNYVSFDWKDTGEHSVGIIAQEELNREWSCLVQKYNEHYSYQYTQHTALIGSALQEEDNKVEALKAEVVTLKNKVQKLERQLWQQ